MSTEPTTVTVQQIKAALDVLGIGEYEQTTRIEILPNRITVERLRRDDEGHIIAAGDRIAVIITTIGVTRNRPSADVAEQGAP